MVELSVFPNPTDQESAFRKIPQNRLIAITAINAYHQAAIPATVFLVHLRPQIFQRLNPVNA
jgi:hypothetical protein